MPGQLPAPACFPEAISNRAGIGAWVRVNTGNLWQIREVSGGSGYHSQDSLPVEFGLGTYTGTVTVVVSWPSGIQQALSNIAVNQRVTVIEGTAQTR